MVIFSLAIAIPTTFIGSFLIEVIYGEDYEGAGSMLVISIWALLFVALGVARSSYLVAKNFIKQSFYFTSLGAVINVGLNLFLIPKYGGNGAAVATLISYAVSAYLSSFLYRPLFKIGRIMTKSIIFPKIK
jgi:O-antigen/teichoic acid export membrane protein